MSIRPGYGTQSDDKEVTSPGSHGGFANALGSAWRTASRKVSEADELGHRHSQASEVSAASLRTEKSEANDRHATPEARTWTPFTSQFTGWSPDKGDGRYSIIRERIAMPALVETGKKAGQSRIHVLNAWALWWFALTRDFFISVLNVPLFYLLPILSVIYILIFFFFSGIWAAVNAGNKDCLYGISNYESMWIFSMVTAQTIGYGNSGPNDCVWAAFVIYIQLMLALILNAMVVGIVFARVAFPQHRGRTIAISNSACIVRRDGILKFIFRLMDMRESQVVSPTIKAFLYTWGDGRVTAEGEYSPVRVEELSIGYIDGMLLLPLFIEHDIDEKSPLIGYTHEMLLEMRAEIVVTFEGTTEFGNPFMARQSYTALEIHWGSMFKQCVFAPAPGKTHYTVDIAAFHEVEPAPGLPQGLLRGAMSELIVQSAIRTVPYPLLASNTLVLSDAMVLSPDENGDLALMIRVGDTYPMQNLNVTVKAQIYRWSEKIKTFEQILRGVPQVDFTMYRLDMGYETGEDRLLLWLPAVAKHVITEDSPLRGWRQPGGRLKDANATILVEVESYIYCNSKNNLRARMYSVSQDVRRNHAFASVISGVPAPGTRPVVDWTRFHDTVPVASLSSRARDILPHEDQGNQHRLQQAQWLDVAKRALKKNHRIVAPELSSIALFPENDEINTFRIRASNRRRKQERKQEKQRLERADVGQMCRQDTLEIGHLPA